MDFQITQIHYFIHNIFDPANAVRIPKGDFVTFGPGVTIGIALDNLFNKRCSGRRLWLYVSLLICRVVVWITRECYFS